MDTEQVLLGQDDKKWDRAWTTDEIRKNSSNWTLAGDAGLYSFLCEFSQNIISRTHEVQNAVDTLVHNTKLASVKINNVINDFHMLSNVQFVENRVYDEEVQEPVPETKPVEKTKEQREAEMLPKIIKAVELGMAVLDQAFNKINVNEISDSEDEDLSSEGRTILEPKDPYEHRPLPFIIGSEEFMADDYAGLKDLIQEDAESSVEIESSSSESSDETSSEEEDLPLDDKFSGAPSPRKEPQSVSDRYSSSEESELFGAEKEENDSISDASLEIKTKEVNPVPKAAEDTKPEVRENRQSSVSSMQSRLNLPQVLPIPKQPQKKKESEDLFADADEGSDDESPFRKKTGLFASEMRFDDEKDMFENDLFSSLPKETSKPAESKKTPTTQKLPPPQKSKEPDLFGDDDDSEDDIFNKLTKAKKPSLAKDSFVTKQESPEKADSSSTPSSAPSIKSSGNAFDFMSGGDPLFGDESDGDDLFSSKKTTSKKFDFAADDDDDDLFGLGTEKKTKKADTPEEKKSDEADKTSPLFETKNAGGKSYKKIGMPLPGLTTKKSKDLIFEDSNRSEQADNKPKPSIVATTTKEKKDINLFDENDDEDDIFSQKPKLFSPGKSPSLKSKPEESLSNKAIKEDIKSEIHKTENKTSTPNLFDDFGQEDKLEDNLLAVKKKPDTSLFEESDTFDLFKPKTVEKKKPVEAVTPVTVMEKNKTDSLFNESDIFDGPINSKLQKQPPPTQSSASTNDQIGFDFDTPADTSKTLNVLSKDRAKISTKRRKPTRKGRLAALETSVNEKEPDLQIQTSVISNAQDSADLFSSEELEVPVEPKSTPTHRVQEKKKIDLMSQLISEAASSKIGKKSVVRKEEKEEEVVDIFSELDGRRESKSQSFSFLSPIESSPKPNLVEDEKSGEKEATDGLDFDEADNDEFFAEPAFRNFRNSISKEEPFLDLDDDDDDLFNIKPNPVLKPKPDETENDIFADDSDIFADIQKEKYEMFPSQLYDDEDDDIFGNIEQSSNKVDKPPTKVTNSVPVKKEVEKKLVKEVEKKPAFVDPLTGLLGED